MISALAEIIMAGATMPFIARATVFTSVLGILRFFLHFSSLAPASSASKLRQPFSLREVFSVVFEHLVRNLDGRVHLIDRDMFDGKRALVAVPAAFFHFGDLLFVPAIERSEFPLKEPRSRMVAPAAAPDQSVCHDVQFHMFAKQMPVVQFLNGNKPDSHVTYILYATRASASCLNPVHTAVK